MGLSQRTPPTVHKNFFCLPPDRKIDLCSPQWGLQTKLKIVVLCLTLLPPYDITVWGERSQLDIVINFWNLHPPAKNVWELHTFEIFFQKNAKTDWKMSEDPLCPPHGKNVWRFTYICNRWVGKLLPKKRHPKQPPPKKNVWETPYIFFQKVRKVGEANLEILLHILITLSPLHIYLVNSWGWQSCKKTIYFLPNNHPQY